ncbi:hypothetical protein KWF86_08035 [Acinetobacter pittii]|uniref:hypothetical protein n=2 Tax=Acinetobacter pittii TaxID=48296 RepID=UPI00083FA224|nr:hypothetical protein [Acinetobacter pittii]MCE6000298.1 hypothetical protein [Acinetobacter pittii]ODM01599.1 hypothetical protein AXH22_08185 [Acinetobacter pittii]UFN52575.1 hypothetical protein LPS07_13485 [Acinetobacter pittii]WPP91078.1 hypothetical protein SOI80_13645 [Acinetobacter pittii]SSV84528.1 Uncharacterised protein [Acinetobacter pittii]
MIIEKIKSTSSITELVSIFITINFIVQVSFKVGFLSIYGYWTISLFNPIEIMFGNLEIMLIYVLIFSSIIYEKSLIQMMTMILCITVFPYIIPMIMQKIFLPPLSIFGMVIGLIGIFITKVAKQNSTSEISSLTTLLIIAPLLFGAYLGNMLDIKKLAEITLNEKNLEKWFILDKFSDNFLLINENKSKLKTIKIEDIKEITP